MKLEDAVPLLAGLGQASRLSIFRELVEAGPEGLTPGILAERLGIAAPTLSFHLKGLAAAGLVRARPSARFIVYTVDFDRMAALMAFLTRNCCKGMPHECLAAVETELSRCCAPSPRTRKAPR
jgi:DNA-binding transcriptional ArsR family regulator